MTILSTMRHEPELLGLTVVHGGAQLVSGL
jgi:hypothetical protein